MLLWISSFCSIGRMSLPWNIICGPFMLSPLFTNAFVSLLEYLQAIGARKGLGIATASLVGKGIEAALFTYLPAMLFSMAFREVCSFLKKKIYLVKLVSV